MKLRFSRKMLGIPYAVFLVFFVIIPMLVILFYAFTDKSMHLSFGNFIQFFSDPTKKSCTENTVCRRFPDYLCFVPAQFGLSAHSLLYGSLYTALC